LEVMGLPFHFSSGEGPVIESPVRSGEDIHRLRTECAGDLGYVADAVRVVAKHFGNKLPVIGFCGAPFTLASYMIEGGGSRHYINTKSLMYSQPQAWDELLGKLVAVTSEYARAQVEAGADVIQVFDSWVGCLSVPDYRKFALPRTTELIQSLKASGAPVIYFGTDTSTLLSSMKETGADVIGLDWRIPLDEGWKLLGYDGAVQGNLDPVVLFADWKQVKSAARRILDQAGGRPGHIFNLGHGILPETPVKNVRALAEYVQENSAGAPSFSRSVREGGA
jgi:uroporphyrinogen decarboxylase